MCLKSRIRFTDIWVLRGLGDYGKLVKSKSKRANTLGVFTGTLLAIWLQK